MTKARDIASAIPAPSTVSSAELGFLDGVTSAIQTQIDSKIGSASAISPTIVDAKGDIIAATAADTASRLAIGANGTVLTADSVETTGMKWVAPAGGATSFSLLGTGTLTGAATITVSGISGMNRIYVLVETAIETANASSLITLRINSDSASNYFYVGPTIDPAATVVTSNFTFQCTTDTSFGLARKSNNVSSVASIAVTIEGCNSSGLKMINANGAGAAIGGANQSLRVLQGYWNNSATVTSVSLISSSGNFTAGTYKVYGSAI